MAIFIRKTFIITILGSVLLPLYYSCFIKIQKKIFVLKIVIEDAEID